jgi:hypothetical protein
LYQDFLAAAIEETGTGPVQVDALRRIAATSSRRFGNSINRVGRRLRKRNRAQGPEAGGQACSQELACGAPKGISHRGQITQANDLIPRLSSTN